MNLDVRKEGLAGPEIPSSRRRPLQQAAGI